MFIKKIFLWKSNKDIEPFNKYFGPLDWMRKINHKLKSDAVRLWRIMLILRKDFSLASEELIELIRKTLLALFAKGTQLVVAGRLWRR